jgi:hypothetical protein
MTTPAVMPDTSIDAPVEDTNIGNEGTKAGPHGEARAKLKKIPDSTAGARHCHKNADCPALRAPRVGRLWFAKYKAAIRNAQPAAAAAASHMPQARGSNCENQTIDTANSFRTRTSRHNAGRMTNQLRMRLRKTSVAAVQVSADMMPSLGVR